MSKTHKGEIKIEIEDEDMIRLVNDLKGIGEKGAKALTNTVNDMKRRAPAQVRKSVTAEYIISPKEITPGATKKTKGGGTQAVKQAASMRIKGKTVAGLRFVYKGRRLTPTHFRMTPTRAPKKRIKIEVPGQKVGQGTPFIKKSVPAKYDITLQVHKGKKEKLEGKPQYLQFYDGGGKSIGDYEALLSKPGALDLIRVYSRAGALLSEFTGYTAAPSIHRRLLEAAEPDRAVLYTIRLMKDEGAGRQ